MTTMPRPFSNFRRKCAAAVLLALLASCISCEGFQPLAVGVSRSAEVNRDDAAAAKTRMQMSFFDDMLSSVLPNASNSKKKLSPLVVPENLKASTEPELLKVTDWQDFASSTAVLVVRLLTGGFALGWKIDTFFYRPEEGKPVYSFPLTPAAFGFCVRDVSTVLDQAPRPKLPLILYEYEASPYCRRVREIINLLDLTVEYRPCPGARGGKFSEEMFERTGRRTVPFLIDPNTGEELFESNDQIEYLLKNYGPPTDLYDRKALWPVTFESFSLITSTLAAVLRGIPGSKRQVNAKADNEDRQPLELWGYEASVFCRPVREKLCSLCLPHVSISCPRGSVNRDKLVAKTGRFQAPYLADPNTGVEMYESAAIVEYLEAVYTE